VICAVVPWDAYLTNLLPEGRSGVTAVLTNSCGQDFTYMLDGNTPVYVGSGDLHDRSFDSTATVIPFSMGNFTSTDIAGHCEYSFVLYATQSYQDGSSTNTPVIFSVVVAVVFVVVVLTFFVYDRFVQRRNSKVIDAATRSNAILSQMFPSNVRSRLFEQAQQEQRQQTGGITSMNVAGKTRLRSFLDDGEGTAGTAVQSEELGYAGAPIADLFPDCTVLFADIAG